MARKGDHPHGAPIARAGTAGISAAYAAGPVFAGQHVAGDLAAADVQIGVVRHRHDGCRALRTCAVVHPHVQRVVADGALFHLHHTADRDDGRVLSFVIKVGIVIIQTEVPHVEVLNDAAVEHQPSALHTRRKAAEFTALIKGLAVHVPVQVPQHGALAQMHHSGVDAEHRGGATARHGEIHPVAAGVQGDVLEHQRLGIAAEGAAAHHDGRLAVNGVILAAHQRLPDLAGGAGQHASLVKAPVLVGALDGHGVRDNDVAAFAVARRRLQDLSGPLEVVGVVAAAAQVDVPLAVQHDVGRLSLQFHVVGFAFGGHLFKAFQIDACVLHSAAGLHHSLAHVGVRQMQPEPALAAERGSEGDGPQLVPAGGMAQKADGLFHRGGAVQLHLPCLDGSALAVGQVVVAGVAHPRHPHTAPQSHFAGRDEGGGSVGGGRQGRLGGLDGGVALQHHVGQRQKLVRVQLIVVVIVVDVKGAPRPASDQPGVIAQRDGLVVAHGVAVPRRCLTHAVGQMLADEERTVARLDAGVVFQRDGERLGLIPVALLVVRRLIHVQLNRVKHPGVDPGVVAHQDAVGADFLCIA